MTSTSKSRTAPPVVATSRAMKASNVLLWLVMIGGILGIVAALWTSLSGRFIWVGGDASPFLKLDALPQVTYLDAHGQAAMHIVDLPLWLRLLAWLPTIIGEATLAWVAFATRGVLHSIAQGRPFAPTAVRGVQSVGLILLIGGLAQGLTDTTASVVLAETLRDLPQWADAYNGVGLTGGNWPLSQIIAGVVVMAASAAFRMGARLQRELVDVV